MAIIPCLAEAAVPAPFALGEGAEQRAWIVLLAYGLLVVLGLVVDVGLAAWYFGRGRRWREGLARLAWRPWTQRESVRLLAVLLALYLGANLLRSVLAALPGASGEAERPVWTVVQSVLFHAVGLLLIAWSLRRRRVTWRGAFGLRRDRVLRDIGTGVVFYLAAIPFLAFYALVYHFVLRSVGYDPLPQEVAILFVTESSVWVRLLLALLAVLLAPFFEEMLFRGMALPLLARRWTAAPAVVAVSALFAMIHFHVPSLVPLFVIAVAFSLGYIASGSILVPVVMHGLFNGVNVALLMLFRAY